MALLGLIGFSAVFAELRLSCRFRDIKHMQHYRSSGTVLEAY